MDLTGWVIVADARQAFLGKVKDRDVEARAVVLEPAYQYHQTWTVDREGKPQGGSRSVFPLDLMPSITQVEVLRPASCLSLDALDDDDRAELGLLITQAEQMREALLGHRRQRRSGLVIANELPKVRPVDGGRA